VAQLPFSSLGDFLATLEAATSDLEAASVQMPESWALQGRRLQSAHAVEAAPSRGLASLAAAHRQLADLIAPAPLPGTSSLHAHHLLHP
jgi:hypothetical protein